MLFGRRGVLSDAFLQVFLGFKTVEQAGKVVYFLIDFFDGFVEVL
jgi:hypothetical protein